MTGSKPSERRSGWSGRLSRLAGAGLVFLSVSGLAVTFGPFHPAVQWILLAHAAIGAILAAPLAWYAAAHWLDYRRFPLTYIVLLGYVAALALAVCVVSGLVVTWQGVFGIRMSWAWRQVHLVSTFAMLGAALPHVVVLALRVWRTLPAPRRYAWQVLGAAAALTALAASLPGLYSGTRYVNEFPKDYMFLYGPGRPFAPSLAKTATGGAYDARSLAGSEGCGTAGCHRQIVEEWRPSAHRYAAMDPLFQGIQNVMAKQNGAESTRYCGGCHDPISLFSGTKNIFVKDLSNLQGYQEGISCLSCHSIRKTDVKGNANFTVAQPREYLWQWHDTGAPRVARDFLIRTYPDEHAGLSKRLFKSPEYCAACHKQFIDQEVNSVGWVQLQNQYDNWANSHWNTKDDPRKTVECRECHMPLVESTDPAAGDDADYNRRPGDRRHRSHRFIASNQLVPTLLQLPGWEEQARLTEQWMRGERDVPEIADKWAHGPIVRIGLELGTAPPWRGGGSAPRRDDLQQGRPRLPHRPARHHPELGGAPRHRRAATHGVLVGRARRAPFSRPGDDPLQGRAGRSARQSDRSPQSLGNGGRALPALAVPGLLGHVRVPGPLFAPWRAHACAWKSRHGRVRSPGLQHASPRRRPLSRRGRPELPQGRSVPAQLPSRREAGPHLARHPDRAHRSMARRGATHSRRPARCPSDHRCPHGTRMSAGQGLSRRRRHLLATTLLLVVAAALATTALVRSYRSRAAATYRPGEANADITNSLKKGLPDDAPTPRFTDVTAEAGLDGFQVFHGARASQLPEDMGAGAAWGDFDNDGDEDLFLVSAGGALAAAPGERAASQLFENLGAGRFRAVADFPDTRIVGMGAAWGDVDGDGWLDLVVTSYGTVLLFRNAQGRFSLDPRFAAPKGFWAGAAFGDYDRDGDLDLYVCGYVQYREEPANRARVSQQFSVSVPYTLNPASYEPERNLLFRNNGNGVFREMAQALGVDNPEGRSLSAVWHDFDGDGWLDLYVANDISDNVMYRNVGGRFEDVSHAAWVADYRGAMGLAVGDWNRDGDDDVFVSHWVAQENALFDSLVVDARRRPAARPTDARAAQSPSPPLRFVDLADALGLGQVALPMVGWGTEFADFDADGWLDLVVANGSTFESDTVPRQLKPQAPFLFWNRRGEHFHDLAPLAPALAKPSVARGLAVADYDNDGDLDILIVRRDAGVQLLSNGMQRGHWLKLQLRSRVPGRPEVQGRGLGAQAVAYLGATEVRRSVSPGSYLSQSSTVLHFGLGDKTGIERLDIRWASGATATVGALAGDRLWEIAEGGESTPREVPGTVPTPVAPAAAGDNRSRTVAFWAKQREAMQALKVERDVARAAALLREAIALDPAHEDTRYYLASSLATLGDVPGALAELESLTRLNPSSHRALARWGALRAQSARGAADLVAAETSLQRAHDLNPEETGALLALGEISLLLGDRARAEQRLGAVCAANPRAAEGLFLLGYLHWTRGDERQATELLARTRAALGNDWKPRGSTAEGDVARKAHEDTTPLVRFLEGWNGSGRPRDAYADLDRHLRTVTAGEARRPG